jgi:hypothetical protein
MPLRDGSRPAAPGRAPLLFVSRCRSSGPPVEDVPLGAELIQRLAWSCRPASDRRRSSRADAGCRSPRACRPCAWWFRGAPRERPDARAGAVARARHAAVLLEQVEGAATGAMRAAPRNSEESHCNLLRVVVCVFGPAPPYPGAERAELVGSAVAGHPGVSGVVQHVVRDLPCSFPSGEGSAEVTAVGVDARLSAMAFSPPANALAGWRRWEEAAMALRGVVMNAARPS